MNIRVKLDLTKILKQHIYQGKKGKYVDLVLWENRDGPDQYGNEYAVKQSLPKEARDAGEKEPYVGNGKVMGGGGNGGQSRGYSNTPGQRDPKGVPAGQHPADDDDDIPF